MAENQNQCMATILSAIGGLMMMVAAFYVQDSLRARGLADWHAKFWSCVFIFTVGGSIIWLVVRSKKPPA